MVDFVVEFTDFIINLITEVPDFFTHVLEFLNDFVDSAKELFNAGNIFLGVLVILLLIKIVGLVRNAI